MQELSKLKLFLRKTYGIICSTKLSFRPHFLWHHIFKSFLLFFLTNMLDFLLFSFLLSIFEFFILHYVDILLTIINMYTGILFLTLHNLVLILMNNSTFILIDYCNKFL